jgi:L-alanine-DL-glutamate epimerase-like enolase superfamily enzyme
MFNVRISKCGGLAPTLRIMALAGRNRMRVQLGCHPGETGLLSAAGRHLAANVAGIRYIEGSYDRHVLSTNILVEDVTFRYGGWAQPLNGPGLGVTVDPRILDSITVKRHEVNFG